MNLLEQCQKWHENDEFQKIVDALEALPAGERTPEMDSELARAYNNLAEPGNREMLQKAIGLLKPHEAYFEGDHCWNYRMGYAYYYLDQDLPALRYFEQALAARPGDEDTQTFIDDCLRRLALPRFEKNFRQRTQEAWSAFSEIEGELRQIMDADKTHERGEELGAKCGDALELALNSAAFELGFNGEKYELILSAEGIRARLFPLVYFQRHAPASVLERWNILVGRQISEGFYIRAGETEIRSEDVQVWAEKKEDRVSLTLYCEKLLPLLKDDAEKAWWLAYTLTDQVLGEISAIALVNDLNLVERPKQGTSVLLSVLCETLRDMGYKLWNDAQDYLDNSYIGYQLKPVEDPDADWRLDVYTGSARLPVLINEYMSAESDTIDEYNQYGIVAGFLCYPLAAFEGEKRAEHILQFREALQKAIQEHAGDDAVTFLGGATGLYYGYLDFIAWDLPAVLEASREFFAGTNLSWGGFHVFRRNVRTVRLWEQEKEPEVDPETGSLLSAHDIEKLESFDDGVSGYFGKMLQWLEDFISQGVKEGKFTQRQARQDLQIALWYSFACNNLDVYRYYYKAAQWMKDSERNAGGCAMWYYRYSVALMYCGRLEEALAYAEKGIQEEPDYPWIWLQAGKLRSHFGDKAGALDAVAHGLALEPGDYEFLTLKSEIEAGEPLERMEYHWINPDADRALQQGLDEYADDKQRTISCITVNAEGLERFWNIFGPKPEPYTPNAPFTQFPYTVNGRTFDLVFQMNEGGMSKLHTDWLEQLKGWLQEGRWLERNHPDGRAAKLDTVMVGLDYRVGLLYKLTEKDEYFQIFLNPDGTEVEDAFWSSEENSGPELYTREEMSAVEQHIARYFGEFDKVFHELVSPDIHVDVCVVPPTDEQNYYMLITMGMGAHQMNVPGELAEYKLERAELAISLPPNWKLDDESMKDEQWYWPIRLLKCLARLPITSDTWLGWGHTMDNQNPFSEDTELCAAILVGPQKDGSHLCQLPGGEEVNFYQVIPLYREEVEYKLEHDAEALFEKMADVDFVVHPNRANSMANAKNNAGNLS
ncbi:MAG TPA: suppressor of fused domain protein [Candidatus Avidehalobacter gallistercoris]|uniref:Suppressor of fused domain protein n=1 Tax=Candidatus Avidehalobacter gallistercoris TaxID=2840694 RepID=A0A9D1HK06_9FIRM|nr:suppressor of fused domain protein [Candidatus Avidehalobacter gallistercoris]